MKSRDPNILHVVICSDSHNPVLVNCLWGHGMVRSVLTSFIATKNCFTVNRAPPSLKETDDRNSKQDKKINFKDVRWPSVSWKSHRVCSIEGKNRKEVQVLNKQINLVYVVC